MNLHKAAILVETTSDQCQISSAASPEMIIHQFSLTHLYVFSVKGWENVLFELRSDRVTRRWHRGSSTHGKAYENCGNVKQCRPQCGNSRFYITWKYVWCGIQSVFFLTMNENNCCDSNLQWLSQKSLDILNPKLVRANQPRHSFEASY